MADLDPRQLAAVEAGPIDLFIAAGAGSGKTHVLTSRFVSAVLGRSPYEACGPGELLAVTYTEKAAGELAERVRTALARAGDSAAARRVGDAWISTIHGMCARILRQHALEAGIDPGFRVLDQVAASALESEALESVVRGALEEDPALEPFMDLYGFDQVVAAVRSARASVRALGGTPGQVRVHGHARTLGTLRESTLELQGLLTDLRALEQRPGVQKWVTGLEETLRAVESALAAGVPDPGWLAPRLAIPGARRDARIAGLNELADATKEALARALLAVDQLCVEPHEAAFLGLLTRFDAHFAALKTRKGTLDFEDLQVKTAELLESQPRIAEEYCRRFRMLMLDESQDSNELQLRIIESLARENLCTVGDENQSIYAFRYADVAVFRNRGERVAERRHLDINYRTTPPLLDAINGLFSHPVLFGTDFMELVSPDQTARPPVPQDGPVFEVRFVDNSAASGQAGEIEAQCAADRVAELIAAGHNPGTIAVLMRALAHGRGARVEQALTARGIRSYLASGGAFFDAPEVLEARALLRLIDNVWDDAALATVLAGRLTALDAAALLAVRAHAEALAAERGLHGRDVHLWDALESPGLELEPPMALAVTRTVSAVDNARRLRGIRSLSDTVLGALLELDADLVLFATGPGGDRAWGNLMKLARLAAEYEEAASGDLGGFLEYLELREAHATSEQEATLDGEFDAVRIMSIHASKGLEFKSVVVMGLGGRPPEARAIDFGRVDGLPTVGLRRVLPEDADGRRTVTAPTLGSEAIAITNREAAQAEAKRLLYVACTRAEENLTLIAGTNPAKEADNGLVGVLRTALGFTGADSIREGEASLGRGSARVAVVAPTEADTADGAAAAAGGGVDVEVTAPAAACGTGALFGESPPPGEQRSNRETIVPPMISYTGLSRYQDCPYSFYLTRVLHLPAPPAMQGGGALVFGSAVHGVLERCRSSADDPTPLVDEVARTTGLSSALKSRLATAVQAYLSSPTAAEVFASERVWHEAPMAVALGHTVLNGSIDVIAWRGTRALIVDYKTGTRALGTVEALDAYRLQGQCYALGALTAGASEVQVVFAELERGRETVYRYRAAEADELRREITTLVATIAARGFPPRGHYEDGCELCPGLGGMCPVTRPSAGASE